MQRDKAAKSVRAYWNCVGYEFVSNTKVIFVNTIPHMSNNYGVTMTQTEWWCKLDSREPNACILQRSQQQECVNYVFLHSDN